VTSYATSGRPVNLGSYRIDEVDEVDAVELIDDDEDKSWYVQVGPGDVKVLSQEQLHDFYRLGVVDGKTFIWQKGMQQWLAVSTIVGKQEVEQTDERWHVLMGLGDVRVLSLDQLDDFFRLEVIDGKTHVWQTGMPQWVALCTLIGDQEAEHVDEPWHVQMGPGDVRQLSLEQLDDFYRLDVINERTIVWQTGMSQWLPLGAVAGIEAPVPVQRSAISVSPAATQVLPSIAASAPPLALSIRPPEPKSKGARFVLQAAIAASLLLTLYRNDVLFSVAHSAQQEGRYAQAERRVLGGPLFGTSRSVEQMIAETGGPLTPIRVPWIVTQMHEGATATALPEPVTAASTAVVQISPGATPATAGSAATAPTLAKSVNDLPVASKILGDAQSSHGIAAALTGQSVKPKAAAIKPATTTRSTKKSASRGQPVFRANGKGEYYDPLNPTL